LEGLVSDSYSAPAAHLWCHCHSAGVVEVKERLVREAHSKNSRHSTQTSLLLQDSHWTAIKGDGRSICKFYQSEFIEKVCFKQLKLIDFFFCSC
jgi:hypothetical protein